MGEYVTPIVKPFLTFEEQIEKLKSRGLTINDEEFAISILKEVNYQKLTAYRYGLYISTLNRNLLNDYAFMPKTKFEDLYKLFLFDSKLKALLMSALLKIELEFRTKIAYYFSLSCSKDVNCYLIPSKFRNAYHHSGFLNKLNSKINTRTPHPIIYNHGTNYGTANLPIYKMVEVITFGMLSNFYKNLKITFQQKITNDFYQKNNKLTSEVIGSWLKILVDLRNSCAHHDLVWSVRIPNVKKIEEISTWDNVLEDKLYLVILIFKELLNKEVFEDFLLELVDLISKYDINTDYMGFPSTWEVDLGIK